MKSVRAVSLAAAMGAALLVTACSTGGQSERSASTAPTTGSEAGAMPAAPQAPQVASSALLFVARAQAGEETVIEDPYFGGAVRVRLEEEYKSASGKTCRRFWVRPEALDRPGQIFFACVVNGSWVISGVY